jgi:hypothetical protein
MNDAMLMISGIVAFLITVGLFLYCLPRGEKYHRWVGTEFEPYVAVAFTAGVALSLTMILSAAINMTG